MELTKEKFTPVNKAQRKSLNFKAGDTVRVWNKIQEKGKTRLQAFEGLVLSRKHGTESGATFTIRKVTSGVGVERIFPLYSPNIGKIEILRKSKTRRNKLYYIRKKAVKEVRKRLKSITLSTPETDVDDDKKEEIKEEEIVKAPEKKVEQTEQVKEPTTKETVNEEKTENSPEPEKSE